jgi:hypothetical protein
VSAADEVERRAERVGTDEPPSPPAPAAEDAGAPEPADAELRCTLCGLRACWTG